VLRIVAEIPNNVKLTIILQRKRTYRTVTLAGTRGTWISFRNMHRTCIVPL